MSIQLIDKTDKTVINVTASEIDASLAELARIATEALRDETQGLKDSVDGTITTIQDIVNNFENTTVPGAVSDVNTARDNAITAINDARQTAIDAIGDEQTVAIAAVNQAADDAIGIINGLVAQAESARDLSQKWAEGTEPGGEGTKSSKEHAEDAETQAGIAGGHTTQAGIEATEAGESASDAKKHAQETEPYTDSDDITYDKGAKGYKQDAEAAASQAEGEVNTHEAKTTGVHGVGESTVESVAGAQAKVDTHENKAAPHGGHETPVGAQAKVDTHEAKTTDVHGITSPDTVESTTGAQAKVDAKASLLAEQIAELDIDQQHLKRSNAVALTDKSQKRINETDAYEAVSGSTLIHDTILQGLKEYGLLDNGVSVFDARGLTIGDTDKVISVAGVDPVEIEGVNTPEILEDSDGRKYFNFTGTEALNLSTLLDFRSKAHTASIVVVFETENTDRATIIGVQDSPAKNWFRVQFNVGSGGEHDPGGCRVSIFDDDGNFHRQAIPTSENLNDGQKHVIQFAWNINTGREDNYVDGVRVASNQSGTLQGLSDFDMDVWFGGLNDNGVLGQGFIGKIYSIAVINDYVDPRIALKVQELLSETPQFTQFSENKIIRIEESFRLPSTQILGMNYDPIIKKVRQAIEDTNALSVEGDYSSSVAPTLGDTTEAPAMYYYFDKSMPFQRREKIIDRFLFWCGQSEVVNDMPMPYLIQSYDLGTPRSWGNSQHIFWGCKMLYEHHKLFSHKECLKKADETCQWLIDNMIQGVAPNRRFYRRTADHPNSNNWSSIKTYSSSDVLLGVGLELGKQEYIDMWYEGYEWLKANSKETATGLMYMNVDIDNPETDPVAPTIHENLEYVDGLLDAYNYTGDEDILSEAIAIYESVEAEFYPTDDLGEFMGDYQFAYIGQKLIDSNPDKYKSVARKRYDSGIHSNIFPKIYMLAYLHSVKNNLNIS